MLNTTIYKTQVTPVTRVVEKSISPDKVTDVYKQVKEEVEKTLIRSLVVESNHMNGVAQMFYEFQEGRKKIRTKFNLNGKEYIETTYVKLDEIDNDSALIDSLLKHFTEKVSIEMAKDTWLQVSRFI